MKSPKGFGKKYFTFASILAHSVQEKLESQVTIAKKTLQYRLSKEIDELDEDPPELLLCITSIATNKPCHCDCLFKLKTKLTVSLSNLSLDVHIILLVLHLDEQEYTHHNNFNI